MGEKARKRVNTLFNLKKITNEFSKVFKNVYEESHKEISLKTADRKDREIQLHEKISEGYKNIREKHPNSVYYNKTWTGKMLSLVDRDFKNVLDYGCGTGMFYPFLKDDRKGLACNLSLAGGLRTAFACGSKATGQGADAAQDPADDR